MMVYVMDTNVAVAANGRDTHADTACQLACVKRIRALIDEGILGVDDKGLIVKEYADRLNFSGAPGAGDAFFRYVFDQQYREDRIRRVTVHPSSDVDRGFEELPTNDFDPSDRKFLAVAVVADAVVLNATDSDWEEHADLMNELGVGVEQLCPQHANK